MQTFGQLWRIYVSAFACVPLPTLAAKVDSTQAKSSDPRPNIVFCMADDWSWPHAGILGDPGVKTPQFDRIAREGVLFENAFVSMPSCTPSRLSILTGQHHWRLKEGDSLGGSLRKEFDVYTDKLRDAGYRIGRFGKGVWPSKHTFRGRDSFGERFRSFDEFLKDRKTDDPFCYWHGGQDPHRPYEKGVGAKSGIDPAKVRVPACLPDNEIVRSDMADYLWEVQRFDREVGEIVERLEAMGELENTIVVVSGDNGMPFPRCKATLYDQGTRVPLAIRWGNRVEGGRSISDFVSLCDLAPTFLQAAGMTPSQQMTGRSLVPLLTSQQSDRVDPVRSAVFMGIEQHVYSYPSRAIRTEDFLYIRNFEPDQWPTGEVEGHNPTYDFSVEPWPTEPGAFSFNIDPSPSKQFLRLHRDEGGVKRFARLAFLRHPSEELYDLRRDPDQLDDVAESANYAKVKQQLRRKLDAELIRSSDPRQAIEGYEIRDIEGWPIRVSKQLLSDQAEATEVAMGLMAKQLQRICGILPAGVLDRLKDVPIWMSPPYEGSRPSGEYHPGANWLRRNGRLPELVKCVEFTNIAIFEKECQRMPMLMLHELAHAYHDQVLDFEHPEIKARFEQARESGSYESVGRNHGKRKTRAYAITNHKEYFAELSEAFFGTNDFYPYTRSQLRKHDPAMFDLLSRVWKVTLVGDSAGVH